MIRWYDYILAIIAADFILAAIVAGFLSDVWWNSLIFGMLAGFAISLWNNQYCEFRLKQENNKNA
jgi:hypothetical protein